MNFRWKNQVGVQCTSVRRSVLYCTVRHSDESGDFNAAKTQFGLLLLRPFYFISQTRASRHLVATFDLLRSHLLPPNQFEFSIRSVAKQMDARDHCTFDKMLKHKSISLQHQSHAQFWCATCDMQSDARHKCINQAMRLQINTAITETH